jgi:ribosomal-protein-alanine N-acetyltransferase
MYADPEVMRFVGDGTTATRQETAEWLERTVRRNALDGWDMRAVRLQDGTFVGRCGIAVHDIDGRAERELGYILARERWGMGYATEGAAAMRDHALHGSGVRRLIALIAPGNDASVRVAEKLGFTRERDTRFHGRPTMLYALEV